MVTFSTRVQGLDLVLIYTSRRRDERRAPLKMPAWEATAGCLNHRQPKLTSRERIRLIISGVRAGTGLFNESGIRLHGGREFIKDLYGNPRYRFRKINTRRNSQ